MFSYVMREKIRYLEFSKSFAQLFKKHNKLEKIPYLLASSDFLDVKRGKVLQSLTDIQILIAGLNFKLIPR